MEKVFKHLRVGDIVETIGGFAFRKLGAEQAGVTMIRFSRGEPRSTHLRFTKLDDSPSIVTWSNGQTETYTAAGDVDSVHSITIGGDYWVTIQNAGPWVAGFTTDLQYALLMDKGYAYGTWDDIVPYEITLDHFCVGVSDYGLNSCFDESYSPYYSGVRKIFIPKTVRSIGNNAIASYKLRTSLSNQGYARALSNVEVEFEATTPPTIGTDFFRSGCNPLRIVVPAKAYATYATFGALSNWSSYVVGKQKLKKGEALPDYSDERITNCKWYSDIDCANEVTSVESSGNYYTKADVVIGSATMDVFYNFMTCGNNANSVNDNQFVLANQGTDASVTLQAVTGSSYGKVSTVAGKGLVAELGGAGTSYPASGGFYLLGVEQAFANGPKTIAFKMTAAEMQAGVNAHILSPNSETKASLGVGASNADEAYHCYVRRTAGGSYVMATATDADYSIDGTNFAFFGGAKDIIGKTVIVTAGSSGATSTFTIYVDGEVVATASYGYLNLHSSDGIIRCFCDSITRSKAQNWAGYTIPYFGMMRGVLTADEVKKLSDSLNAIA